MPAVHYYLGRPARVWISALHAAALQASAQRQRSVHSGIPGQPARRFTPSVSLRRTAQPMPTRVAPATGILLTATSDLAPDAAPNGGLLARHRIAFARFGTDVAAAGGIGRPWPPDWTRLTTRSCPEGTPGLGTRPGLPGAMRAVSGRYEAQVAELHLLIATVPGRSLPLSHRHPLTDPSTDAHGHVSLIRAARRSDAYDPACRAGKASQRAVIRGALRDVGRPAAESAPHAAARPADLYIAARTENARACR